MPLAAIVGATQAAAGLFKKKPGGTTVGNALRNWGKKRHGVNGYYDPNYLTYQTQYQQNTQARTKVDLSWLKLPEANVNTKMDPMLIGVLGFLALAILIRR